MDSRFPRPPGSQDDPDDAQVDADFAAALGRAIKVFRTGLGMSRRDLAGAADLSYSYVTEIENGKKQASAGAQKAIAAALGLSVSELLAAGEAWVGQLGAEADLAETDAEPDTFAAPMQIKGASAPRVDYLRHPEGAEEPSSARRTPAPGEEGARRRQLRWFHTAARQAHAARVAESAIPLSAPSDEAPGEATSVEEALRQLRWLLERMEAGDRERVVDLARRLARG